MGRKYTIQEAVIVLDENTEVVDWFDSVEEAEKYIEEMDIQENEDYDQNI